MDRKEKLNQLEELLNVEQDTLGEETELDQISEWDSMAVIALIAMFDAVFGKVVAPSEVRRFKTVKNILDAME